MTSDSNNSCHDNQHTISRKQISQNRCNEQQLKKKFRRGNDDIIDKMLMQNLSQMNKANDDEEELYGRQVAATLRWFTNRQKTLAKLRIQSVLIDVEFLDKEQHYMPQMYGYG